MVKQQWQVVSCKDILDEQLLDHHTGLRFSLSWNWRAYSAKNGYHDMRASCINWLWAYLEYRKGPDFTRLRQELLIFLD
mgnify:CR=1 FL=1